MEILRQRPEGFAVLSGDDAFSFPMIALGADGLISVASNEAPELMARLVNLALEGNWDEARELHYRLLPLMEVNFIESSPGPVKAGLAMMNLIGENYRLPLVRIEEKNRTVLRSGAYRSRATGRKRRMPLRERIEALAARTRAEFTAEDRALFDEFKTALNKGEIRDGRKRRRRKVAR